MPRETDQIDPPVGLECVHRYQGVLYKMVVVATADGGIGYSVDGVVYASPTAAAKAVIGKDQFIYGRKFWHLDKRPKS